MQTRRPFFKTTGHRFWASGVVRSQTNRRPPNVLLILTDDQGSDEFLGFYAGHWNNYFDTILEHNGNTSWANDWIPNWTDAHAYAWWPLRVVEPGTFEVSLLYICPQEHLGTRLRVEVAGETLNEAVRKAHNPDPVPSPDRVPRGEVYEKIWVPLAIDAVRLEPGETRLILKALDIPGGQACDIKAVQLRRID